MLRTSSFFILLLLLLFVCCQNKTTNRVELARVFNHYLYLDEVPVIPNSVDSIIFIHNYIDQWATQKLLIQKAEFNLDNHSVYVDSLVNTYRASLLIHYYKEAMVQEYLDTVITDSLISIYYYNNIENFKLKEDVVKVNYIKIKNIAPNIDFVAKTYTSLELDDVEKLEEYCLQFSETFFLGDVDWISWSDFSKKLPISKNYSFQDSRRILRKNRKMELKDSTYIHFIFIQDFKLKGTSSPLEYVSSLVHKILINKRKKELMDNIEFKLLEEALINNNFEIYD